MLASELVSRYGKRLLGQRVLTETIGEWPGGPAEVTEIGPMHDDENIVLQVRDARGEEIGVFHHERIELLLKEE